MDLNSFFSEYPKIAIAFSGGVDSAYLLYAAKSYAADIQAYYVKSDFQPQFELDDAVRLAAQLEIRMRILPISILEEATITANPQDRCYYCKKVIFATIMDAAEKDGYTVLADGTNASDEEGDRPGMKALRELKILSPLKESGLKKSEIRKLSREAGLFTWNKPAYACLATRIPTGETIIKKKLQATEQAENYLSTLGFRDFRVRMMGNGAKLQFREEQLEKVLLYRKDIIQELKKYYSSIVLDLEARE